MKPSIDNDEDHFDIGFEQFKVRPGLELEVHEASGAPLGHKAEFVSVIAGKGVLISIAVDDPSEMEMHPGERYRVSGFNGRFDFAFTSEVLKVDRLQLTVMLALPVTVAITFVRKHQRTNLALAATVTAQGKSDPVPVTIRNLSPGGAGLTSAKPLGARGGQVTLRLQIVFDNQKENLNLVSVIRRVSASDDSLLASTGVEFMNPSRDDKLLLLYYITTLANEYNLI